MSASTNRVTPLRVAGLAAYLAAAATQFWCTEDAYISFRYARNMVHGHGLRFNIDEPVAIEGYSNFLWVMVAAVPEALGLWTPTLVPLLSVALGAWLVWRMYDLGRDHLGLSDETAAGAMMVTGFAAPFATWASSGLEPMPQALAFLMAAWFAAFGTEADLRKGVLAGLALALLRTEGIAWSVVFLILGAGLRRHEGRPIEVLQRYAARVFPVYVVWFLWKWWYHGDWVSNVARAKVGMSTVVMGRGLNYVASYHLVQLWPLLVPIAAWWAWRRMPAARARLVWATLLAFAAPGWSVVVGGDYMDHFRFLVSSVPFAALAIAMGLQAEQPRRGGTVLVAISAILAILGALPLRNVVLTPTPLLETFAVRGAGVGELDELEWDNGAFRGKTRKRGLFLEAQVVALLTKPGDSITTAAIGMVGYFNPEVRVTDLCGLTSRKIARREVDVDLDSRPGHEKCTGPNAFYKYRPDILSFTMSYDEDPVWVAKDLKTRMEPWFKKDRAKRYAPYLVGFKADVEGGIVWGAGLKLLPKGMDRTATWKTFEAQLAQLASETVPDGVWLVQGVHQRDAQVPLRAIFDPQRAALKAAAGGE